MLIMIQSSELIDFLNKIISSEHFIQIIHRYGPWKRAQLWIKEGSTHGLAAYPSEERKTYLEFNSEPLLQLDPIIFFASDNPRKTEIKKISNNEDLKNFSIVDVLGNGWGVDPFYTTKDRAVGTGLELTISYGIVKDHHGELTFES